MGPATMPGEAGNAREAAIHYRSPNFAATRSAMAPTACSASGPFARTRMLAAELRREHHHAHDALAVHLEIVAHDRDLALELGRELHDLGGWTRVQPVLVHDFNRSFRHHVATE